MTGGLGISQLETVVLSTQAQLLFSKIIMYVEAIGSFVLMMICDIDLVGQNMWEYNNYVLLGCQNSVLK